MNEPSVQKWCDAFRHILQIQKDFLAISSGRLLCPRSSARGIVRIFSVQVFFDDSRAEEGGIDASSLVLGHKVFSVLVICIVAQLPELVQVSQSTYLRSMKDRNLSFKRRPERVPGAAHASYMVDIPEEGIENFIDRITGANGPDGGPPPSPKKRSVDGESIAAARYSLLPGVAHKSDTPPDSRTGSVFSETSSRVSSIAGSGFKQGDSYDTPASVSSPPAPSNGGEGKRRSLGVARDRKSGG